MKSGPTLKKAPQPPGLRGFWFLIEQMLAPRRGFLFRPHDRVEVYSAPPEFIFKGLGALPRLFTQKRASIDADTQRHH